MHHCPFHRGQSASVCMACLCYMSIKWCMSYDAVLQDTVGTFWPLERIAFWTWLWSPVGNVFHRHKGKKKKNLKATSLASKQQWVSTPRLEIWIHLWLLTLLQWGFIDHSHTKHYHILQVHDTTVMMFFKLCFAAKNCAVVAVTHQGEP